MPETSLTKRSEIELAVLGLAMTGSGGEICLRLTENMFIKKIHRHIFNAINGLVSEGMVPDAITVYNCCQKKGLEVSMRLLLDLYDCAPSKENTTLYVEQIFENSQLQMLKNFAIGTIQAIDDAQQSPHEIITQKNEEFFEIGIKDPKIQIRHVSEAVEDVITLAKAAADRGRVGINTGFPLFDKLTMGLQNEYLILIAGRPSVGKTALMLNMIEHMTLKNNHPALLISLEMGAPLLLGRTISRKMEISTYKIRSGNLEEHEWALMSKIGGNMTSQPFYIADAPSATIPQIATMSRQAVKQFGAEVIFIDYLQLISVQGRSRNEEIGYISASLKQLARELKIPVVALSQLSRSGDNGIPKLSHLRDCVSGDTLVVLADGRRFPIRDLVGQTPDVLTLSPKGKLIRATTDKIWSVGKRPVYNICLSSGRIIRATENHRLFTAGGWRRISELSSGDRIATARVLPEPDNIEIWADCRVALLGHLIGDGSYIKHQALRYSTNSDENKQIVQSIVQEEFGAKVTCYNQGNCCHLTIANNGNRWHPRGVNKWLRDLGIFNQRSYEKRMPTAVFCLGNNQIGLLLRHLWATDGTIHVCKSGATGIAYSTNSLGLAMDVAALLLRFGIVARISVARKAGYKAGFIVVISGLENQKTFLNRIGAFGARKSQGEKVIDYLLKSKANTNVDTLPNEFFKDVRIKMKQKDISHRKMAALRGTSYKGSAAFSFSPSRTLFKEYAEILNDEKLRQQCSDDLFWDKIKTIYYVGEEEVYDLTVPKYASWLADGIVSHNSGSLEQDADHVVFVHRERDSRGQLKNEGTVIIAKARNERTGVIDVLFDPEKTRFLETEEEYASKESGAGKKDSLGEV